MWSAWRALKDHAKARTSKRWPHGIPFHLKLKDFITFAKQTNEFDIFRLHSRAALQSQFLLPELREALVCQNSLAGNRNNTRSTIK